MILTNRRACVGCATPTTRRSLSATGGNALAAYLAADAALAYVADAERELADIQVRMGRLITPP